MTKKRHKEKQRLQEAMSANNCQGQGLKLEEVQQEMRQNREREKLFLTVPSNRGRQNRKGLRKEIENRRRFAEVRSGGRGERCVHTPLHSLGEHKTPELLYIFFFLSGCSCFIPPFYSVPRLSVLFFVMSRGGERSREKRGRNVNYKYVRACVHTLKEVTAQRAKPKKRTYQHK